MIGDAPFWPPLSMVIPAIRFRPGPAAPRLLSPLTAIRYACVLYSVEENAMLSHRRELRLVKARALVVWALRALPRKAVSYPKIGCALGGRDHSTIINLHRMATRLRLEDAFFARCCQALQVLFEEAHDAGC